MPDLRDDLRTYFDFVADEVRAGSTARRRRPRWLLVAAAAVIALIVAAVVVIDDASDRPERLRTATSPTSTPAPTPTTVAPLPEALDRRVAIFPGLPPLDASSTNGPPVPFAPVEGINGAVFGGIDGMPWVSLSLPGGTIDSIAVPLDGSVPGLRYHGDAMSVAATADAYWLYVREFTNPDNQYRLLRYRKGETEPSVDTPLPVDGQPAGGIAVSDDAVWIPLRPRLARVDPATGEVVAVIPMDFQDSRSVAVVNGTVVVSDGTGVRTVDPVTNTLGPRREYAPTRQLWTSVVGAAGQLFVAVSNGQVYRVDPSSLEPVGELKLPSPDGSVRIQGFGDRIWVTIYLRIGVPPTDAATDQVVMLIDPQTLTVTETAVIHSSSAQVWVDDDRLLLYGFRSSTVPTGAIDPTLYSVDLTR
jgi:hypothetical protein